MKKFKQFIPFLLAAILALAIPLAACGSCKKDKDENKTLVSISVNADNARDIYGIGDEPIKDGLVVTAYFLNSKSKEIKETLGADDYKLISAFTSAGKHTVTVSYAYEGIIQYDSYEVNVVDYYAGLEITLLEGVLPNGADAINTYNLSGSHPTVEIDTSKIIVKEINDDGTVGKEISDYDISLYKGQEKISLTNGKATVDGGAYAIWVEKTSDYYVKPIKAFAVIYVNDNLESIEKTAGSVKQPEGVDLLSGTWKFTATYASGATKEIDSDECSFTVDTMSVGSRSATVTYSDTNASGTKITKTCSVQYTIEQFNGTRKDYNYSFSAFDTSKMGNSGDFVLTDNSYFEGANSFLKLGSGTVTYRNKTIGSSTDAFQIENEGLLVTFEGTGKIIIGFSSTGGSNTSRVGLKDANGNFVHATYAKTNANIALDDSLDENGNPYENSYLVTGTNSCEFTFIISEAGTYSIVSETNVEYNRGCRIQSISMIDYVPAAAAALRNVEHSNQTYIVKKVEEV